jgi:hypothetical protein
VGPTDTGIVSNRVAYSSYILLAYTLFVGDARTQVLTPANFTTTTTPRPGPGPPLERIGSGGSGGWNGSGGTIGVGGGRESSSSSSRFSMLGLGGAGSSISLRNIGIGARNASGQTVDDEIRIPVPGFLLSGGLEEATSSSSPPPSPLPPEETTPMRWAAGSCTICLGLYQIGESVTWSSNPDCEHCFHTSCIEEWVLRRRPQKNNHRRRRAAGSVEDDDASSVPLCPNCRRPFVVVGPLEGGGGGRGTRAGTLASGTGLPVVTGNDSINIGAAARAAAHNADPFEGAAGGSAAVYSPPDPPPDTPDAGGGNSDGDGCGGASSRSDGPCPHSIDV